MLTSIFSINLGAVELIDVKIEDIKGSTELNLPCLNLLRARLKTANTPMCI